MNIKHLHLDELYRAYATQIMEVDGEMAVLIASEEKNYPGYMYRGEHFKQREHLWEKGGGCMSIIPIPNKKNEFLAVMDFYLKESPSTAKLVWGQYRDKQWEIKDVVYLPYLHRFDIVNIAGINHVICATIADHKEFKDDWRQPGSIYAGILPDNPSDGIKLDKVATGFYRNHGYSRKDTDEGYVGYFTSDQGIVTLQYRNNKWVINPLLEGMISEVALIDINGDGKDELITIEPFHGNTIKVYELIDNSYQPVFTYPFTLDFGHALVASTINGEPAFIGGIRRVNAELFIITCKHNQYRVEIIDRGGGPANLAVGHRNNQTIIAAANHTRNEAGVYIISP